MAIPPFADLARPFPEGQTRVPFPPHKGERAFRRTPPAESIGESYRTNILRVTTDDGGEVDLVPASEGPSASPADLFGAPTAWFVASSHAFGRPTTQTETRDLQQGLVDVLKIQGWDWRFTACFPPSRQWVEVGALLLHEDAEEVTQLAFRHGQDVVLRWDASGLTPVATGPSVAVDGLGVTSPVMVQPAATGCPLVCGRDEWCKREGGPWTSGSITAAAVWQHHRQMLVEALGCTVCEGGPHGPGAALALRDLFLPSRSGGWQWGAPRRHDR